MYRRKMRKTCKIYKGKMLLVKRSIIIKNYQLKIDTLFAISRL